MEDSARDQAKKAEESVNKREQLGLLHGIPVTLKDNIYTQGVRTTFGSKLYENFVPDSDAVLVARLKRAGAIILGKTNMPEFGLLPITDNLIFGSTQNPWDHKKTSGGSSGGSAAAVAAGLCPISIGNDTGGSLRIPASLCGVYGFKPSFGRVPIYPRLPGWDSLIHEGPITRTVADAALTLEVLAGPDERDRLSLPAGTTDYLSTLNKGVKGLTAAYSHDLGYAIVDPEIKSIVYKAALTFESLGCKVEEIKPNLPDMLKALETITITNMITANEQQLNKWKEVAYPANQYIFDKIFDIANKDLVRDQFVREQVLWEKVRKIFDEYDLLITPTSAVTAFDSGEGGPIGPTIIDNKEVSEFSWTSLTDPFNFTGQPAASIPCGFTKSGLPVGLQIIGRRYSDHLVLQASAAFEEAILQVETNNN
ncbi:amidase [Candidatus Contubernalis alkalaceticus]|nr:amidase [Candidatus Contubernalis alkalaceticus]UNC92224.1 amidase [Candidatus Contubernalis alkalaceticus]